MARDRHKNVVKLKIVAITEMNYNINMDSTIAGSRNACS
jgi:hypothetical protein